MSNRVSEQPNRMPPLSSGVVAQTVLEVTDTLVVVLDANAEIQYVNPACEALTGYSADRLEGEILFDVLVPEEDRAGLVAYWNRLLEGSAPTTYRNHWNVKEGAPRYITWSNALVEADDGTRYVVATGLDITERQQLERDVVRVSESERQRIGQELHDTLASDLVAAAMKLDNLRYRMQTGSTSEDDLLERLEDIEQSVRQGGKRARSLSHLLAAGDLSPRDLPAALSELVRTHREFAGVDCELRMPDEWGVADVVGSETASHLYRIAQEAVRNAVTHADPDHVSVQIDLVSPDDRAASADYEAEVERWTDRKIVLRVRDDGMGIPESVAEELEATTAARPSRDVEVNEEGIGLHLMKYRADLIGADLRVESETDQGTLIKCVIPLSQEDEHE